MGQAHDAASADLPEPLWQVLRQEIGKDAQLPIFELFLSCDRYYRPLAEKCIRIAMDRHHASVRMRNIAILMLENHLLKIPVEHTVEFDFLLVSMHLKDRLGVAYPINASVLQEGYATTDLQRFICELHRRLLRLQRVHELIRGLRTTPQGLREFLRQAQQDCKLSLARYFFTPQDVVQRIHEQLRLSRGIQEPLTSASPYAMEEAAYTLAHLPTFEAAMVRHLCMASHIYWLAPTTHSTLHALVEHPVRTVVVAIKPPGSHIEFEIKRTGMRAPHLLNVVYARDGQPLPPPHRLQGGNMGTLLIWEADAAAVLARLYRLIHGEEPPISRMLSMATVYTVPTAQGEAHILDYFTDAETFGEGFDTMREAMTQSVAAFQHERSWGPPEIPGDLGLTTQFLTQVTPKQGILVHTSSFRLDRLALYLSPDGPESYFRDGLQVAYAPQDAQHFADDILDEILGVHTPPAVDYGQHAQYLYEAFAVPANRQRADQHYRAIMQQIGTLWGTLLAMRGHSRGESFVGRNVGLKSVWEHGQWRVRIRFMDHDNLHIGKRYSDFYPRAALNGMAGDAFYIFGLQAENLTIKGTVPLLEEIYRINPQVGQQGRAILHQAAAAAYHTTQDAMTQQPQIQQYFHPSLVQRIRDWDTILAHYFQQGDDAAELQAWETTTRQWLADNAYPPELIEEHIVAIKEYAEFLSQLAFLYDLPHRYLQRKRN
jgi:hypothetical protein